MKSRQQIEAIVETLKYKDWKFEVFANNDMLFLRVVFEGKCSKTGEIKRWTGRKWTLSNHMTKSEIVQTAFKAVVTAEEHETRESFLYKGRTIFAPHYDVDELWSIADDEHEDVREEILQ